MRALPHIRLAIAVAMSLVLIVAGQAFAHLPPAGAVASHPAGANLPWQYASSGDPSWLVAAVDDAIDGTGGSLFASPTYNNSRTPNFYKVSSSTATVIHTSQATSPCTGSTSWLACSTCPSTSATWHLWIRNFDGSSTGWRWYDATHDTSYALFDLRRSVLHEALHVSLEICGHDNTELVTNSLMRSIQPAYNATTWNVHNIERCDEAAAQLHYGVATSTGPYADCFDHITNHGVSGLKTKVDFLSDDTRFCLGSPVTFTGILEVGVDSTNYKALSGQALGGRVAHLQRATAGSGSFSDYSSTTASSAGAYSFGYNSSSSQTWDFRVRYAGEVGLDPGYSGLIEVTWSTIC